MECNHCKGNIVRTYDGHQGEKLICLQCGRAHDHKCDQRCLDIKYGSERQYAPEVSS